MINACVTNYNKDTSKDNSLSLVKHVCVCVCVCLVFGNSEKKSHHLTKFETKTNFADHFHFIMMSFMVCSFKITSTIFLN